MADNLASRIRAWFAGPLRGGVRRGADQGLDDASGRYELVLAGADAAIWDWDVPRHKVSYSPRWKALRGFAEDEVSDAEEEWSEAIHPDDAPRVMAAVQAHFEGRTAVFAEEYRVRRKDGSWMWVADRGLAQRDADGRVVRMAGSETDITERKLAEAGLRASWERLEWVLDQTGVGTWLNTLPLGKLSWDLQTRRLFFVPPEVEPSIELFWSRLHPDDREPTRLAVERALRDRTLYSIDHRAVDPQTGQVRWIRSIGQATCGPDGSPTRFDGINLDITERKRNEEALEVHRQLLETVVNHMPAAVCLIRGSDLRLQLINPACQAIAPGKEMLGKTLDELWPETGQDFAAICRRVLETGESHEVVDELNTIRRHPDGPLEPAYFSWSLHRVHLPGNERWGLVIAAWETTASRQAEAALRESEQRYRTLFVSMAEGFALHEMIFDEQGRPSDYRFLEVNPAFARLTGLDAQEILGRTVRQVIPTVEESWIETYGRVAQTGRSERFERHIAALGRWYDVFAFSPAPGRFATAFTDISARKQAEEDLRQSREDLHRGQEVGQIGSWRLDVRRNVLTWSDENHRIFGVPKGTPLTYEAFLGIVHPDDREYVDAKWNAGLRGEPYDIEHRIVAGEQVKWVREKAYLEFDSEGALLGGFGITQDITDLKRAEQELRESLAEKELLLREIHHRVKNNLQVVSSLVSLQADALADPALREVFGEVRDRVRSMGLVHEKLYEFGGLSQLNFADYAASLTRSLWNAHGAAAARVKLQLEVEPVALSVATAVPCGLILNELVSNALKHGFPSRGGAVTVDLTREPGSGRLLLRVQDNGVGLPAGFDLRQTRSLGLRLVRMLAAQLQGTVETGPGPGTEFRVSFVAKEVEGVPALSGATRTTTSEGHP